MCERITPLSRVRLAISPTARLATEDLPLSRSQIKSLDLQPGDLQIFFGRYSLHRVTPVEGDRERHTVIFAYAKEPGFIGRPERAKRIFGRMAPVHERLLEEGMQRSDSLAD